METQAKDCPICGLLNPGSTDRCECGYDFTLSPALQEARQGEAERERLRKMRAYLRMWGVIWLIAAVIQFFLHGFLSAAWGVVCVALGVIDLAFPFRPVIVVNGVVIIVVGLGNAAGTMVPGSAVSLEPLWFGIVQILAGARILMRFATEFRKR